MIVLSAWLLGALIGVSAAQRRGLSMLSGVIGGVLLGPLAFLMYFTRDTDRQQCPACAEFVKREATVCKHCRHALAPVQAQAQYRIYEDPAPWTINTWLNVAIAVVALLIVGVVVSRMLL